MTLGSDLTLASTLQPKERRASMEMLLLLQIESLVFGVVALSAKAVNSFPVKMEKLNKQINNMRDCLNIFFMELL